MLKTFTTTIERIAPLRLAESWDNVGLLIEAPIPRKNANTILLTNDLTTNVLEEALANPNCGIIFSYHPPLFSSFKRLTLENTKQEIALKCVANGISVYSSHTALDSCQNGVNDWLASLLPTGTTTIINEIDTTGLESQEGAGSGRIHTLKSPTSLRNIVDQLKARLQLDHLRIASKIGLDHSISTVAICAGSGNSLLSPVKADLYLTGEMGHHDAIAAVEKSTSVILTEHSNSERGFLTQVLQPLLTKELGSDFQVLVSTVDKDPLLVV